MKQWTKRLMERLSLSHIRWMIIGFFITEFITWLLFKNPKKITAPGLSAMVAVFALILAIYSAYQVKKWINGKVNDKGFKKCEAIIDNIQEIAMSVGRIHEQIGKLFILEIVILDDVKFNLIIEKLESEINKLRETQLEMFAHAMHLSIWGFDISEEYQLKKFSDALKPLINVVNSTVGHSKRFRENGDFSGVKEDTLEYNSALDLVKNYIDKVNDSTFNEIFVNTQSK
ncbi:hypothetical protein ACN6UN_001845 [Cronobacter turicensis]